MTQALTRIVEVVSHAAHATSGPIATLLLVVAAFAAGSLVLYGLTRGKEFLVAGYSSVLFLVPFIHLS